MNEYKKPNILEFVDEKMQEGLTEEEALLWWDCLFCDSIENDNN